MHRSREHQLIPSGWLRDPSVINERERDGCGLCSNFAVERASELDAVHGLLLLVPHTPFAAFDVVACFDGVRIR